MIPELTPLEARIVGCLMEKEVATPDQYPLSLNALTNACNQKSNRHPVMGLSGEEVQAAVDGLMKKHYVTDRTGFGARVPKYSHRFCNTHFGQLHLSSGEYAVVCELLLRGPQTPGELRTHASRLHPFKEVAEVDRVLHDLSQREEPLVAQMAREPGRRECRWAQLFTGAPEAVEASDEPAAAAPPARAEPAPGPDLLERVAALEAAVTSLVTRLDEMRGRLDGLGPPTEGFVDDEEGEG